MAPRQRSSGTRLLDRVRQDLALDEITSVVAIAAVAAIVYMIAASM